MPLMAKQSSAKKATPCPHIDVTIKGRVNLETLLNALDPQGPDPIFEGGIPAQYTPTKQRDRWYDCIIVDMDKTMFGKPAALIWTLTEEHVAILVAKENLRYG